MKSWTSHRVGNIVLLAILVLLPIMSEGLRSIPNDTMDLNGKDSLRDDKEQVMSKEGGDEDLKEYYATGSSLPDCSHACGPCFPCKRVMVSFKCSVAESCPVVYRCMCNGRYYHVPSN
ncbi:protein EPIDERMAL PATTERNING FACTOR 2-like [Typha angustifolia]|uniref:protein EPIDERMAL PATTERNING FACTOR 2-like n=1 Tax=Typha angustifolia TaxID=59011 RepID=UPI003C2BE2B6